MKIKLTFLFMFIGVLSHGQGIDEGRNFIKLNALTLFSGKYSIEYERKLSSSVSFGASVSFRKEDQIPYSSLAKKIANDEDLEEFIDDFRSSNFSVTPELRFYTSKKKDARGFYIAPYAKYAVYNMTYPIPYEIEYQVVDGVMSSKKKTTPVDGKINTLTAGLSFGFNFKLSKNLYMDWRLIGPGYGISNGDISGRKSLHPEDQELIREKLDELDEKLPSIVKMDHTVHDDGIDIRIKGPWAAMRSGLSLSYRF